MLGRALLHMSQISTSQFTPGVCTYDMTNYVAPSHTDRQLHPHHRRQNSVNINAPPHLHDRLLIPNTVSRDHMIDKRDNTPCSTIIVVYLPRMKSACELCSSLPFPGLPAYATTYAKKKTSLVEVYRYARTKRTVRKFRGFRNSNRTPKPTTPFPPQLADFP